MYAVAVPAPVRRAFHYLPPAEESPSSLTPGVRVMVPFGSSSRIGVLLGPVSSDAAQSHVLKRIARVLDNEPMIPGELLGLMQWAADYYHHPVGEVMRAALPGLLRRGGSAKAEADQAWRLTPAFPGDAVDRAPLQAALVLALKGRPEGAGADVLRPLGGGWRRALAALTKKGWVEAVAPAPQSPATPKSRCRVILEPDQRTVVNTIRDHGARFGAFLLDGVTGSGKTEVYLDLIQGVVDAGCQALVLVPEIGLTPQTLARFQAQLSCQVAAYHSGLSEGQRRNVWLQARAGVTPVVVGTRSAVFLPMPSIAMMVVDEEHDGSYKQQEGFRYSARDLAVMRARRLDIPVVLGSATPSLESLHNVAQQRYQRVHLPSRAQGASQPSVGVVDLRQHRPQDGLSQPLLQALGDRLQRGEQSLLFLNRRGYAPVLLCHDCTWVAACSRCDARLVVHRGQGRLRCHHCGCETALACQCPACGSESLRALGLGTQRLADALAEQLPEARIMRIDRDSIRRKGELETVMTKIHQREVDIVVGTQMLAKGHDFPDVTLAAVVDGDAGLFSADFRAGERMAQLIVQMAGRAGRRSRPGEVLVQTHDPGNPMLQTLLRDGYAGFADIALAERGEAGLPPAAFLCLLRAQAVAREAVTDFLQRARELALKSVPEGVQVSPPVPAFMERRAGRIRWQLLIESTSRKRLHAFLADWLPELESNRVAGRVRWSVDVDPVDLD
ncbi:MAG: primosomal protein N' [Gammaproteobacteria bacterium]|nr:MAG: primosomal protein N' [Gammaproteobacteria bacterium]